MVRHPGPTLPVLALLIAALAMPAAAQNSSVGNSGPSDGPSSPFFPAPSPTLAKPSAYVPPDQGVPGGGDGDDGPVTTGSSGGDRRAPGRGNSSRSSASGSPAGGRTTAPGRANDPAQFGIADSWLMWWETNKFDFIQLRRVSDAPLTGQGLVQETADQRARRLETVAALLSDDVLPRLRELTGSKDPSVRAAAVVAMAKLGDAQCAPRARELLLDPNWTVRRSAMLALGIGRSARGSYQLMSIAADDSGARKLLDRSSVHDDDRGTALITAALRGDRSLSLVLDDLLDDRRALSDQLLTAACEAAGLSGDADQIATLTDVARDDKRPDYVRAAALTALGRIGDPAVVPTLLSALESGVEPRRAACVALGLAAHGGLTWVVDRLVETMDEDKDAATRHFAAISLGRLGGEGSRQALLASFVDPASDMRPWLALGLALCERAEPEGRIPALLAGRLEAEANVDFRAAYLVALGLCGGDVAVDALIREVEDGKVLTSSHAALALGLTGHPDAGAVLRRALEEASSPTIQGRAALGLGVLGNAAAVPTLVELIRNTPNADVASYSALGIGFLGDENAVGPLLRTIEREGESGLATRFAVTAVGQLFDSDRRPALSRLASGDNYLARSNAANQLLLLGF